MSDPETKAIEDLRKAVEELTAEVKLLKGLLPEPHWMRELVGAVQRLKPPQNPY